MKPDIRALRKKYMDIAGYDIPDIRIASEDALLL